MVKRTCQVCGKEFQVKPVFVRKGGAKYCSRPCYNSTLKGRTTTLKGQKFLNRRGKNNVNWKNGTYEKGGYVLVYQPYHPRCPKNKRYIKEHVLVAEQALNRFLTPDETIHHLDEVRDNNKIENLYLFPNQTEHKKYHANIRWGNISPLTKSNLL
jgi:HNH endonuclease